MVMAMQYNRAMQSIYLQKLEGFVHTWIDAAAI